MRKLIYSLILLPFLVFASDTIIVPKNQGTAYFKDGAGDLLPLNIAYTTDGSGHLKLINSSNPVDDSLLIPKNSGKMFLEGADSKLYPALVLYTTDGNGNVIPIPSGGGGGSGTVTSVGLSLPAIFSVSGSPVTTSGTLTGSLATQTANKVWAGPTTGSAAAPTFRSLVNADIPPLLDSTFLVENASDTTKLFNLDLSGETTGKELTLAPQNTSAMTLHIPQVATAAGAGMALVQDETTGFIFSNGITSSIGGANSMMQLANASTANRAQIKLHSYFNGASVAGVSTLTSRSGTIAVNSAVVAGQDYSKWTAQAAATTSGSAPISGTWSFKANTVNSLTVTSDFHLQLTNLAGTLGDRLYLGSEGALQLPFYTAGVGHFDSSGNMTSSAVNLASDVTGVLPIANGGTNNSSAYTAGSVLFSDGTKVAQDNTNLFWDDTNDVLKLRNGLIQMGSSDPFGRKQIWNKDNLAVLRLGSWEADGDSTSTDAEGVVVYGESLTGQPISPSNGGLMLLSAANSPFGEVWQMGMFTIDSTLPFYSGGDFWYNLNTTNLYYRNNAGTNVFSVDRATGNTQVAGSLTLSGSTSGSIAQSAAAVTTPYSIVWPAAQGAASSFLQNDGSGNLSWVAGGSGATTALDNLTTTNINQSLLFNANNTYTVGSSSNNLLNIYAGQIESSGVFFTAIAGAGNFQSNGANKFYTYDQSGSSSALVSVFSGNTDTESTGVVSLFSGDVTASGSTGNTGDVNINSGQVADASGTGNTGSVVIQSSNNAGSGRTGEVDLFTGGTNGAFGSGNISAFTGDANGANTSPTGEMDFGTGAQKNAGGTGGTGSYNIFTGDVQVGSGATGAITSSTGSNSGTGDSGNQVLVTGNAASGNSGDIDFQTGTASGTRGSVRCNANMFFLPQHTTDPTGVDGGQYYNTSTHKIRWYNGTTWADL